MATEAKNKGDQQKFEICKTRIQNCNNKKNSLFQKNFLFTQELDRLEETHFEIRSPLGKTEHLEETEEEPSTSQNEEDLETSHIHKLAKSHKKIRKLKKENTLLKKKAKKR